MSVSPELPGDAPAPKAEDAGLEAHVGALERKLGELTGTVRDIDGRLRRIEETLTRLAPSGAIPAEPVPASAADAEALPADEETDEDAPGRTVVTWLTLAGRSFLVLGGAFLARAMTDYGLVPSEAGFAIGLAYAGLWLFAADRAGRRADHVGATFHGLTAAIIAFPLLWEGVTRFEVLSPPFGALLIAAVTVAAYLVCRRRSLPALALGVALAAAATATGLGFAARRLDIFATLLLALGAASAWLGEARGWRWLGWPVAVAADTVVAILVLGLGIGQGPRAAFGQVGVAWVVALALGLFGVYLGCVVYGTLFRRRPVAAFDVIQTLVAITIGFGGALFLAHGRRLEGFGIALGTLALLVAGIAYATAFGFARRRADWGRNFAFYSSVGLVLAGAGLGMLLGWRHAGISWAALGVAAAVVAARFAPVTLGVHSAVCGVAAAAQTGLVLVVVDAFAAPAASSWRPLGLAPALALGGVTLSYLAIWAAQRRREVDWPARIPRAALAFLAILGLGAVVVIAAHRSLELGTAAVATVRTAVLAAAALALAAARKWGGLVELGWFVYPVLLAGAGKLIFEDLRHGAPLTLFVSFACYGTALFLSPRWIRRVRPAAGSARLPGNGNGPTAPGPPSA